MYLTADEKEKIANENIKLAHYFANKYKYLGHEYDELFSSALQGFTKALNAFNPSKGYKFATLVSHAIIGEILKYNRKMNAKMRKGNLISLDAIVYENSDGSELTLLDMIPDESDSIDWTGIYEALEQAMTYMGKDEKEYLSLYMQGLTQTEISEVVGVNQVQVSRRIRKAFAKVKDEYWKEAVV